MRFNYLQLKIANALINGDLGIPELSRATGEEGRKVEKELREMEKLKLVGKKGDFFALNEEIAKEIRRRRALEEEDAFKVRIKAFIETQALSDRLVKKYLDGVEKNLNKDPEFTLYHIDIGEPVEQGDFYSGFVEVNFSAKSIGSIIRFVLIYSPSSIEVIKPPKAEFTAFELQEALMDLTNWSYKYNEMAKKHLKRAEIERFNESLFQQKKK